MADLTVIVKLSLATISIIVVCLRFKNDFGSRKRYHDEYALSKEILKENNWKNCSNVELNMWYRSITQIIIDARIIRHMFTGTNPLLVLINYANGIRYINEEKTEDNQLQISFKNNWMFFWKKDWQWQMNFYTILYFFFSSLGIIMFLLIQLGSSTLFEISLYIFASVVFFTIAFIYPLQEVWDLKAAKIALDHFNENPIGNTDI